MVSKAVFYSKFIVFYLSVEKSALWRDQFATKTNVGASSARENLRQGFLQAQLAPTSAKQALL